MSAAPHAARSAVDAADRGDLRPARALLQAGSDEPTNAALRGLLHLAGLGACPTLPPIAPGAEATEAALMAASVVARAALLAGDRDLLAAARDRLRFADAPASADSSARVRSTIELALAELALGASGPGGEALHALGRRARALADGVAVIDAGTVRALGASLDVQLVEALRSARAASRAARTEALPQAEYLANVVLARVRRLTSKPHFAVRILAALQRFVPPPWQPWLTWELSLCSPRPPNRGEANGFWSGARAWWFREQDRRIVDAAFRPESCRSGDSEEARAIDAWRRGTLADAPFGVIALAPQDPPAWVLAMGRGPGRRTIDPPAGVVVLPPLRAERWRSDALLAELALGGDWLRDEDLFAAVWGFAFVYELHFNTFNLAVHRARERLGTNGSIERDAGSSRLVVQAPLLVPDPRCRLPIDHELLELLAREPISARSAAEALGIPLRTVQAALRELVDAGVCARRKDGRDIVYRVEDTTFCEPTHA